MLPLAMILIYLVMVGLFRSYLDPFIIMFAVPLGFIGVIWMLLLTHTSVNVESLIGTLMMIGIVVSNSVLLVDFAPLGHAALHLNVRPTFGIVDALQNLHRMDSSLLDGLMTQCKGGLQLLAGPQHPHSLLPTVAEMARLFDLLVAHFRYVIVDCSSRLDQTSRMLCGLSNAVLLVAQTDVVSLWSAGRLRAGTGDRHGRPTPLFALLARRHQCPDFNDGHLQRWPMASRRCRLQSCRKYDPVCGRCSDRHPIQSRLAQRPVDR